jgi:microcompartment protein CcmK/EutM
MILCRVTGDVVAPVKNDRLEGKKLLICQPIDLAGKQIGAALVAVDLVQAGEGDTVLVNKEGGGARITLGDEASPVQSLVVAVVDDVAIDRREPAISPPAR